MILHRPLRFGIKTSPLSATHEALLDIWREADALPIFEHAWVFDHFMPLGDNPAGPCLEGWTLLAALAAQTQRLRVGVMVTSNTYRYPAVLAKMATTIDIITHGRLNFGIGAGSSEQEHRVYGIPLYHRFQKMLARCRQGTQSVAANHTQPPALPLVVRSRVAFAGHAKTPPADRRVC